MWKYIGTKECNEFLLSLNLINCKDDKKYMMEVGFHHKLIKEWIGNK